MFYVSVVFGALFRTLKSALLLALMLSVMVYILSFYDEARYSALKKKFYPVWRSALTRVCDEDSANKLEVILVQYGNTVNKSIVTGTKLLVAKYKQFHTYVTTDETIQGYVNSTKTVVQEYWLKLRSMASGDEKQKSWDKLWKESNRIDSKKIRHWLLQTNRDLEHIFFFSIL